MAIRPELHVAVAKTKNKASDYNDNFDMMMDFVDNSIDEAKDYVDGFMPAISGSTKSKFLTNDGTDANWVSLGNGQPFSQYINGLVITKSTDDAILVSAGSCYDYTGASVLILGTDTTKQNSSQSASTTYYVYIIGNGTLVDVLIDASSSSPTLPSGYTLYRQIGKYTTDSDSKINYIYNGNSSSPDTKATIVETYINGASGYNIYSNGYCEQWGINTVDLATVNLLKSYKDTNYCVTTGTCFYNPRGSYANAIPYIDSKTVNSFRTYVYGGAYTMWLTCGYLY